LDAMIVSSNRGKGYIRTKTTLTGSSLYIMA
jgi:hypothetical protein